MTNIDLIQKSIWIQILGTIFVTPLIRHPQERQGYQKMHKNILEIDMLIYGFKIQPKLTKNPENLKKCAKNDGYSCLHYYRAEPGFDIDITNAHNLSVGLVYFDFQLYH